MSADPTAAVAERVRRLLEDWTPPDFAHVKTPEMALFMCAIDHKTGYEREHAVDGRGPFTGSELMWELAACAGAEAFAPEHLIAVSGDEVESLFEAGGETVAGADERAWLWREIATMLVSDYGGGAQALLDACNSRLGGEGGLLARLALLEAYADPLAKKAQLFAKIAERRGWFRVRDPEQWQVSADNVLMRLALRSGLVAPGPLAQVRADTRDAFKRLADELAIAPPVLDDLLWELGRDDRDLLGSGAGDLAEPGRERGSHWY